MRAYVERLRDAAGWSRLEGAVVAANFWMLDEYGGRHNLDGSRWRFAGRRRHDYHYISRWSPDDALWDFGQFSLMSRDWVRLRFTDPDDRTGE
jgi:hypothetical protein